MSTQADRDPMAFRVAQTEALVEQRDTFAQVTVDFGAKVIVAM
jgi:hypothetical protein